MATAIQKRRRRVVGAVAGTGVVLGAVAYVGIRKARAQTQADVPPGPDRPDLPDPPVDPFPGGEDFPEPDDRPTLERDEDVPAMTQRPYNTFMFPNSTAVWGNLVSLNDLRYSDGAGPPDGSDISTALKRFQRDYNRAARRSPTMANAGLAATRLDVDGVPGKFALRGLEWARALDWLKVLNEANIPVSS